MFRYYVIQGETKIKYILKRQSYDILCSIFFLAFKNLKISLALTQQSINIVHIAILSLFTHPKQAEMGG